uniref:Ig-like domain-containing protein n=1 Tax=Salarias fasciatus TaxID=181472 RepID=A0A672FP07_SALFA
MFSEALLLLTAASCVLSIDLTQPESMVVQPGQSLSITCQVTGYSLTDSSYATGWVRQREGKPMDWISHQWGGGSFYGNEALKSKFSSSRDTSAQTVTIQGQNMQPEDSGVYYCVRLPTVTQNTVSTSTGPTVFPLSPCSSDSATTFTLACLATGFSPASLTFSWTKSDTALTDFLQYPAVQRGETYTGISQIQVKREDWNKLDSIKCLASHPVGQSQGAFVFPGKSPAKENMIVIKSDRLSVTFSCIAKDFAPKEHNITWQKNTGEITGKIDKIETISAGRAGNETTLYSASSFLSVEPDEWSKGTTYTCVFERKGKDNISKSVTYKESTTTCKYTMTCSFNHLCWFTFHDEHFSFRSPGSQLEPGKGKQSTLFHTIDITYEEWSQGTGFFCVVEHDNMIEPLKKEYQKDIGKKTRPSVFMLPPVEHPKTERVTLTCFVKDFSPPEVFVSWLVNDEEAGSEYDFNTTSPVESKGSYSAYGQLTLSFDQWSDSEAVYSCVVYHESLVNTTKAIVRSIGYRTFEKNNVVNLSMNVPDTCKAQ